MTIEEAANNYASVTDPEAHGIDFIREVFIAGAEWQAEQLLKSSPLPEDTVLFNKGVAEGKRLMMEDAVEGIAQPYDGEIWLDSRNALSGFAEGDKIHVIVLQKED